MVDFKQLFISMMLVAVVALSIFSFVITSQQANNSAQLITNNTIVNDSYGDLLANLGSAQTTGNLAEDSFGSIAPTESFGIVDVTSVVSPTKLFKSLLIGTYNTLISLPIKILGVPPVIAGVISAVIFLLMILGIWAIWRGVAS